MVTILLQQHNLRTLQWRGQSSTVHGSNDKGGNARLLRYSYVNAVSNVVILKHQDFKKRFFKIIFHRVESKFYIAVRPVIKVHLKNKDTQITCSSTCYI